jgi:hypothetical protein
MCQALGGEQECARLLVFTPMPDTFLFSPECLAHSCSPPNAWYILVLFQITGTFLFSTPGIGRRTRVYQALGGKQECARHWLSKVKKDISNI